MVRARVNGVELHYDRAGGGPPVVFVHGGFSEARMLLNDYATWAWSWENDYAACFDFTWYDRRGCYRSACPPDGYSIENQTADLDALLDHLGLRDVHLIGSSAGGPIAVLFAAMRPDRVRSLQLVGTSTHLFPVDDPARPLLRAQLARLEREGADAAFDARPDGVETYYGVLWERDEVEARGELAAWLERGAALARRAAELPRQVRVARHAAELRNLGAYLDRDVRAEAARVRAPTLVLHGSADQLVPLAAAEALASAIPAAELRVFPDGPHSLLWRLDEARAASIGFVERTERADA